MAYPLRPLVALGNLEPADMHSPQNGMVLSAIRDLIAAEIPPEPPIVWAALERKHGQQTPSGMRWEVRVFTCLQAATIPEGCGAHRIAVLETRLRHQTREWAAELARSSGGPLPELHRVLAATLAATGRTLARIAEQTPAKTQRREVTPLHRTQDPRAA